MVDTILHRRLDLLYPGAGVVSPSFLRCRRSSCWLPRRTWPAMAQLQVESTPPVTTPAQEKDEIFIELQSSFPVTTPAPEKDEGSVEIQSSSPVTTPAPEKDEGPIELQSSSPVTTPAPAKDEGSIELQSSSPVTTPAPEKGEGPIELQSSSPVTTPAPEKDEGPIELQSSSTVTTPAPAIDEGPIELPQSSSPLNFGDPNQATPLQIATSVLLTGAISVFLFRSLRRRAKRAKELRVRSSGVTKEGVKEEALDRLKAMQSAKLDPGAPPSPLQALWGGLTAGAIAILLYKFTITIEASLNQQTISDNFSVRQITITIRTIINGLCYLATFVFGANSVGLILYSGQLAINAFMENSEENVKKGQQVSSSESSSDSGNADESKENNSQTLDKTQ